jgi:hypothetical protein
MALTKKTSLLLVFIFVLIANAPSQGLDTTDYLPLRVGNKWFAIWYKEPPVFFSTSWQITGTETINDTLYYLPRYYRKDSLGNVYQRIGGIDQLLYKVTADSGETWTFQQTDKYLVTLEIPSASLRVFAGSFTNCKEFFFKNLDRLSEFDYFVWLAPGIGEALWSGGMDLGNTELKRAEINSMVISAPFSMWPRAPWQNQADIDTSSNISFDLYSIVDTNLVLNKVRVFSKKEGEIGGVVHNYGNGSQRYTFYPSKRFPPSDTIVVRISANIIDVFGEGLDGNGDGRYEGSPTDDYTWTFFTQTVTKVHDAKSTVPDDFVLHQNYPNPFNPSTTISFSLQKSAFVTLKVYNTLGQEAASLVNGETAAGRHQIRWEAGNLPGGVYFCQLRARGFQQMQKMILMK